MPPAIGSHRGQAVRHGQLRLKNTVAPPAAATLSISRMFISLQQSNAAHHAPPGPAKIDDNFRVGGRVHALVGRRPKSEETRSAQPPRLASRAAGRGTKPRPAR